MPDDDPPAHTLRRLIVAQQDRIAVLEAEVAALLRIVHADHPDLVLEAARD